MRTIHLTIAAGPKMCDQCVFLGSQDKGLAGESRPACRIFAAHGEWRAKNMKRAEDCLASEGKRLGA